MFYTTVGISTLCLQILHYRTWSHLITSQNYHQFPLTHPSSGLVVVQVHLLPQVPPPLAGVHELPAEFEAEVYVVRASAPVPLAPAAPDRVGLGPAAPAAGVVAVAGADRALAARPRDGVGDGRARDRVDERGLATT